MDSLLNEGDLKRSSDSRINGPHDAVAPSSKKISYVDHPDFACPELVHDILESLPRNSKQCEANSRRCIIGKDYHLPSRPILDVQSERSLFLRMNLLKCLASRRLERIQTGSGSSSCHRIVESLLSDADDVRNEILEANQRLVVSNASRFSRSGVPIADLISEANLVLIKAVNGFDVSRGFRLSTYATYAIRRHLSRYVQRHQKRLLGQSEDVIEPQIEDVAADWIDIHPAELVREILSQLPPREREIVSMRFGLTDDGTGQTLHKIGHHFGISKERVRQLISSCCAEAFRQHAGRLGLE